MGADLAQKRCFSDAGRFADLINGLLLEGEQCVRREDLREIVGKKFGEDGGVDMCEALTEMLRDERMEGQLEMLFALVRDGIISIQDAAVRMEMSEECFVNTMQTHFAI